MTFVSSISQFGTRVYSATRFVLQLPDPADRVDVRVLDAAYENLGDNAAHLTLGNDFLNEQMLLDGALSQARIDTPTVWPRTAAMKMYPKADGEFYKLDEFGVETPFNTGGGCIREEFLPAAGAITVTLSQVPMSISAVGRDGMMQSEQDGHYTPSGQDILFAEAFNGAERVVVEYALQVGNPAPPWNGAGIIDGSIPASALQTMWFHEEFLPAAAATTVALSRSVILVLTVSRGGVVQSEVDGNYTLAAQTLSFPTAFTGSERLVVAYVGGTP